MNRRRYWLFILLMAAVLVAQSDKDVVVAKLKQRYGYAFSPREVTIGKTKAGDVATGAIIDEENKELLIDTAPCKGKTQTFHDPYKKKPLGTVTCNGKTLERAEVRQE